MAADLVAVFFRHLCRVGQAFARPAAGMRG
jgi:hypothetical protein